MKSNELIPGSEMYDSYIRERLEEGWDIEKHKVVEATFPISYVECTPQHILWRLTSAE